MKLFNHLSKNLKYVFLVVKYIKFNFSHVQNTQISVPFEQMSHLSHEVFS